MATYGVLGTGMVGRTLASRLVSLGHTVVMGSRTRDGGASWAQEYSGEAGRRARVGTFAEAAEAAEELVVNATKGDSSVDALTLAGAGALADKVVLDVSNPLDFSRGFPPSLTVCNTGSLGEQIQAAFPESRVVKALNTVSAPVMVEPGRVPGLHTVFMAGNHVGAKDMVVALLEEFGWDRADVLDLGDITAARGTEAYLLLWTRVYQAIGTPMFNVKVLRD